MKPIGLILVILALLFNSCHSRMELSATFTSYVNPIIGAGGAGMISPVVSVPFGMVQMGADTRMGGSGYFYGDQTILGFSHIHKSGGGCGDFLDIRFMPLSGNQIKRGTEFFPDKVIESRFSHTNEKASPGYYQVKLEDFNIRVELTATPRCGMQKYTYETDSQQSLLIDLKYGSIGACTIVEKDNYDTVKVSVIELVDQYTVRGYRITNGWAPEQHVYFYTRFSKPVNGMNLYTNNKLLKGKNECSGTDIKAVFFFDQNSSEEVVVKTGISAVDTDGAKRNLESEINGWNFSRICRDAREEWNRELSKIRIDTEDSKKREIFYTALYNIMKYPMLYSDLDGRFRGPDHKVHSCGFPYYGQVIGVWDTFRGACPLLTILKPEVMNDYVRTFLEHYEIFGQLPVWVLAGGETFQMLGLHSLPVIADCYYKGIRGYNAEEAFQAMKTSAMKDATGFSMHYFVGLKNYKKFGYVPADLEMESVARTLEYAYDDWTLAQMAKMLGKTDDYSHFLKRSASYKSVFDKQTQLMRGRFSNGNWREPFDPFASNHRRDDFCEGNAWQWTFFAPHDVRGLANLMGGKDFLIARLDTLFSLQPRVSVNNSSGDISGLIGQYAHGNEPSHHIAYMYSYLGQPWKTQKYIHQILTTLYDNTPEGICGNEDTGQMSAWYVLSSIGFYPVRHGDGTYVIGSPSFKEVRISLPEEKILTIKTNNLSDANIYIQSVQINGKPYNKAYFLHNEMMKGGKIVFEMGPEPNPCWGTSLDDLPPSMNGDLK